jgi:hypothetical protein
MSTMRLMETNKMLHLQSVTQVRTKDAEVIH